VQVKAWTFAHRIQGPINRLKSLFLSFFSIPFSLSTSSHPLHSLLLRSEKEIRWGFSTVAGRPSTAPPPCRNPRVLILLFFCFFSFPPLFSSFFNHFFIIKKNYKLRSMKKEERFYLSVLFGSSRRVVVSVMWVLWFDIVGFVGFVFCDVGFLVL